MEIMKKAVFLTILSVITVICVVVGCGIHIMGWWGGTFLSAGGRVSHEDSDIPAFTGISVDIEVGNLTVKPSRGYRISYECSKRLIPEYRVEDGVLIITSKAHKKWFWNFWPFGNTKSEITVTVPEDVYLDLFSVTADVGDVNIEDMKAQELTVETNVGDLDINGGTYNSININADVGDVDVRDSVFDRMEIYADVGDVDVTGVGDMEDYGIRMSTDIGDISVNGEKKRGEYVKEGNTDKKIVIETDVGDSNLKE